MNETAALVDWHWQGKLKYWVENCLSATLSTTNNAWTGLISNPGLRGKMPATHRLNHGTAQQRCLFINDFSRAETGTQRMWREAAVTHSATSSAVSDEILTSTSTQQVWAEKPTCHFGNLDHWAGDRVRPKWHDQWCCPAARHDFDIHGAPPWGWVLSLKQNTRRSGVRTEARRRLPDPVQTGPGADTDPCTTCTGSPSWAYRACR